MLFAAAALRADKTRLSEAVRQAVDLHRQGLYQQAEKAAGEAFSILENERDTQNFEVAAALNNLATLAYAQGQLDRAARLFERSRDVYQALAGPDDTRVASVLYNLAGVYVEQGRYAQAEALFRNSLEIRKKILGAEHPLVGEELNNLGFLYLQQGKYPEAETWLRKALTLWERSTGTDTAYAAITVSNLARLRRMQGSLDESESLYRQALAVEEKVFGQDHPEVATTLMSLGALYRARGKNGQAVEIYKRALALLEKKVGGQDPLAVEARQQLNEITGVQDAGEYQILLVPTKQQAEELRRRLEKGENFAELAARYSIDPSASQGGLFRTRASELRKEIRAELDRLAVEQLSPVFPLAGNWAIVKKISEPAAARE